MFNDAQKFAERSSVFYVHFFGRSFFLRSIKSPFLVMIYCPVSQEWQWRNILFTIVMKNINVYTPFELMRIDRSFVY